MKKEKSEIEKLVETIYHKQTYGKDCDKEIEKLNRLTGAKVISSKPLLSSRFFRLSESQFHKIGLLTFRLRNEAKREPRARKVEQWGFAIQKILDAIAEKNGR